jgi:hypothetical protein
MASFVLVNADRLGEYFSLGPWWLRFSVTVGPWGWAGTFYAFRRRIWWRPIDYAAADASPPYVRSWSNPLARLARVKPATIALYRAVKAGRSIHQ